MKYNIVEIFVGAVVVLITVGFVGYGYSVMDVSHKGDDYIVYAEFDSIDGIDIGSDIKLSGIKVGTVKAKELNVQSYSAKVTLSVGNEFKLPDDTSAKISSEGILGGNYISLSPGGSEDFLESGDEILYTQGSVDLISLVSKALFSTGSDKTSEDVSQ